LKNQATSRNYEGLNLSAAISPQALEVKISGTCGAIYEELKEEYSKV
jgi:hypothetical protein